MGAPEPQAPREAALAELDRAVAETEGEQMNMGYS